MPSYLLSLDTALSIYYQIYGYKLKRLLKSVSCLASHMHAAVNLVNTERFLFFLASHMHVAV